MIQPPYAKRTSNEVPIFQVQNADVEFDFFIKKYAKGPEGNYYSVRVLLKNDSDSALLKTWDKANRLGDYILEKDIDNTINKYIDGISVEHRAIKKYNL